MRYFMTVQDKDRCDIVTVLPVIHSPPQAPEDAIEIDPDPLEQYHALRSA